MDIATRALLVSTLGLVAACGESADDRPQTLQYITTAILTPTCGASNCHSAMVQQRGWRFDSIDVMRDQVDGGGLVSCVGGETAPCTTGGDPDSSFLYIVLTRDSDPSNDSYRMPRDSPMPAPDVDLIRQWIIAGAPEE